ncbi:unnamed protein product [Pleuronectes platessa]|uniref:Uncharacterized protein n=1 Tax=Pleuronectes platessa TaxID=8262 RepID=A0A9N7UAC6_PLEPL|nr:unnamed protein product [Pleuronectes platessa]
MWKFKAFCLDYWHVLCLHPHNNFYKRTEKCLVKNQVGEVTQNGLSQLLNWGSPSLLRGLPIESSVIVGRGPDSDTIDMNLICRWFRVREWDDEGITYLMCLALEPVTGACLPSGGYPWDGAPPSLI